MGVFVLMLIAAAIPAASPMAMAVAVTRVDACAPRVALWQRPATSMLLSPCGTSDRYGIS